MRKGSGVFTKVLVVDDDRDDFELIKAQLVAGQAISDREMFLVEHARSAEQATQMDRVEVHDVYIVDYYLHKADPRDTGLDYVRRLFRLRKHPTVILVSGREEFVLDAEILRWMSLNQLAFLHKSELTTERLNEVIDDMLGQCYRVLIVDDDPGDLELIAQFLNLDKRHRFETIRTTNLAEARSYLEDRSAFDAVLLDYRLGVDRGTDLAEELLASGRPIPILLLTGDRDINLDERAVRMLGRRKMGFLSKDNLGTQELLDSMRNIGALAHG